MLQKLSLTASTWPSRLSRMTAVGPLERGEYRTGGGQFSIQCRYFASRRLLPNMHHSF